MDPEAEGGVTGLAESSALLLLDKACDVWQMMLFAIVIRLPRPLLMQHMGHAERLESRERQEDQIHSRGGVSGSQERDLYFYLNKCER